MQLGKRNNADKKERRNSIFVEKSRKGQKIDKTESKLKCYSRTTERTRNCKINNEKGVFEREN